MKTVGWRAKVEDRQEWNRTVEQTETHPGLQSQQKKKKKKKKNKKEEEKKKKRRPKEDGNCWLEGEGRGWTGVEQNC